MEQTIKKTQLKPSVAFLFLFLVSSFTTDDDSRKYIIMDEKTAIEFAKVIWKPYYGNLVRRYKPFEASIIKDSIWVVQGTLKTKKGGKPYIEFNAYDCTVYKMSFGK